MAIVTTNTLFQDNPDIVKAKKHNSKYAKQAMAAGLSAMTILGANAGLIQNVTTVHADNISASQLRGLKKATTKKTNTKQNNSNDKAKAAEAASQQNNNQNQNDGHDLQGQAQYTVASGDTLLKIAHRANISLQDLLTYNQNIKVTDIIHPGQKINLNNSQNTYHIVKHGETLSGIAKDHQLSLQKLYDINGNYDANHTTIKAGDKVKVKDDGQPSEWQKAHAAQQQQSTQTQTQQTAAPAQQQGSNFTGATLSGTSAQKIVQLAQQLANSGIPYVWGGTTPAGFDCSGLAQYVYRNAAGINLPRTANAQAGVSSIKSVSAAQPGDMLFWSNNGSASGVYHVAIYIGNGQYIAAPQEGQNVQVQSINAYFPPSFAGSVNG